LQLTRDGVSAEVVFQAQQAIGALACDNRIHSSGAGEIRSV